MAKIVIIEEHGNPVDVVKAVDVDPGLPGPGEVLVSGILASINPADLNTVEGIYPIRPKLPGTPGVEGAGVVERVGEGVKNLKPGTEVILPHGLGCWREACVVAADRLVAVPKGLPYEQVAMLKINPATAWRMLHDFVTPEPGMWVIQNAANSAVGRSVIVMARELGLRTINLVRRPELIPELKELGGDVVLLDNEEIVDYARTAVNGKVIRLALNAVGGESAIRMANTLANCGTVVTYGAMGRQPVRIPNGLLIFKDLRFRGFWVSKWYQTASAGEVEKMFAKLFDSVRRGLIHTPVEKIYPVAEVREAVAHALRSGRSGKILLGQVRG